MPDVLIIGSCGYIGSALEDYLRANTNWNIDILDWKNVRAEKRKDFDWLEPIDDLYKYSHLVLLAGNPSVASCNNLYTTFNQNVEKFVRLINKLQNTNIKLIYACSASVYIDSGKHPVDETYPFGKASNFYDWSKQLLDKAAEAASNPCIGLRFGTLSGFSHRPRLDLLINKLVYDAKTKKQITVNNVENYRAVLGMQDLCRAIKAIIEHPEPPSGVYNLASLNGTIGYFAQNTQRIYENLSGERINLIQTPDTGTYSFNLDCTKFKTTFNFEFQETIDNIVEGAMNNYVPTEEELPQFRRD